MQKTSYACNTHRAKRLINIADKVLTVTIMRRLEEGT